MRKLPFLLALLLGLTFAARAAFAADGTSVRAILIVASPKGGGSDPKLAQYESDLKRYLPRNLESFRAVGEGSATVPASGKATLTLAQGHRLELQSEQGRINVRWLNGGSALMEQPLNPRSPRNVFGGPSAGGDDVWAVVIISK